MFDHLIWWQVLALLLPVVGVTYYIRYQEQNRSITHFRDLTPAQKTWVLLNLLPPGSAAKLQQQMEPEEQKAYVQAGQAISGNGRRLHDPVIKEFLSFYDSKQVPSEPPQLGERVAQLINQNSPASTMSLLRRKWPAGQTAISSTPPPVVQPG